MVTKTVATELTEFTEIFDDVGLKVMVPKMKYQGVSVLSL